MIDWKKTQAKIAASGKPIAVDGIIGPNTMKVLVDTITGGNMPREAAKALVTVAGKYPLDTTNRLASFIAQCAHESGGFTKLVENLNYSAKGLRGTWVARFPNDAIAAKYARNPEMIANKVYADRMGNGSEASGDGWKYRGRGYIMLTGKSNYAAFAKWVGISIDEAIVYAATPEGAMMTAMYFWITNKLNNFADKDNIMGQRLAVNGGVIGIVEVKKYYERGKSLIV